MKKLVLLSIVLFAFVAFASAQRVYTVPNDTLDDAETINLQAVNSSSSQGTVTLQATFTQLSGTSAGTANFQGSVDGVVYQDLVSLAGLFEILPSDALTITNGAVYQVIIQNSPYKYYRLKAVGAGTQSTEVSFSYLPKIK